LYTETVDMRGRQLGEALPAGFQPGWPTLRSCPAGPGLAEKRAGGPGTRP
jgi:hypothetical protein